MILTKKELKEKNIELTRAQIAERVLDIARLCLEDGSYKNAIGCLGRMVSLSKTINDDYWEEKFHKGASYEGYYLLSNGKANHPDKDTIIR